MLKFSLDLTERHWVEAKLDNGTDTICIEASYLSDGIRDLIISVAKILQGESSSLCKWETEPGEYRWMFNSVGTTVTVKIIWFDDTFSRAADDRGKIVFEAKEDILKLAGVLSKEVENLHNEHEDNEYRSIWGYEFPEDSAAYLRKSIKLYKFHN